VSLTGRVRGVSRHTSASLTDWRACSVPPGTVEGPDGLERAGATWTTLRRSEPIAAALREAGTWSLDGPPRRFDAEEWWYRASFPRGEDADEISLCFDGLATLADVWLNGAALLSSDNMFVSHERSVRAVLADHNDLFLRFRSLDSALGARRPRPRWRTPMVEHQQLRWIRTTLLGRTPGWSPPAAVVGPWRDVRIERRSAIAVEDVRVSPRVVGDGARLDVSCVVRPLRGQAPSRVEVLLERAGASRMSTLTARGDGLFSDALELPRVELWWPHTHGDQALYRLCLVVHGYGAPIAIDLGAIGFRDAARSGDFGLALNGTPVFCRGACWTPPDPVTLISERPTYEAALRQARDAGMNMLRLGGTMAYESDDFYDLADELGILVWQDFMFANMDYPDDPAFVASVEAEARQILGRLQGRPSLAVLCGNSEGEQQAAMWGAPRELWRPRLFHEVLPRLCADAIPDVPYWPSSAHGGAFPHDATVGTTSYYGVGAYLRPLDDARRSEVRFATECLAFANVPGADHLPGGPGAKVHHPGWKARTPRDLGAGWDFDDVRDHYLETLFGVDPMRLRYADHDRYLALGRVVTGEVMASVMGEWRRKRSVSRGGLLWFLRDLWTGAGWGVVDAGGRPKAAYHYVRRALQPIGLHLTDEGGSGLFIHVVNERASPLGGEIDLTLYKAGEIKVASARTAVMVAPRDTIEIPAARLFEGFLDLTYAYRFGPPSHDLVVATLSTEAGGRIEAFYFPLGLPSARVANVGLTATARPREGGDFDLVLHTRAFAQSVALEVEGFAPDDDFFHIAPGAERTVRLRGGGSTSPRGHVQPLNAEAATKITVAP
jgi:beta-mannosidase